MNKKKIILIIIGIIFLALIIYALIIRQEGDRVIHKDDLTPVTTSRDFMIVNRIMNDYLLNVSLDNEDYVKGVTGNDVMVTNTSEKYTYYIEKLYYVELTNNLYFYVSGRKMEFYIVVCF